MGDEVRIFAADGSVPSENNLVALRKSAEKKGFPEVFDSVGTALLNQPGKPVLMDELGFFEKDAALFQQAVFSVIDSDTPVLGVIKPKHTPFLDRVRNHPKTQVIEITRENREDMYPVVLELVKKTLF